MIFSNLLEIALAMKNSGHDELFIEQVVRLAMDLDGIRDLMILWSQETTQEEKDNIISDLQDEIDEYNFAQKGIIEKPTIQEHQLDSIHKSIVQFKLKIREKVDAWGGVAKLSKETGIAQPSLSRFFNTSSMPRRTTLYKIAKATKLKDSDITFEWVK